MTRASKSAGGKRRTRNPYPESFRQEVVRLADIKCATQAAEELNITPADVYRWRRTIDAARSQSESGLPHH